MCYASLLFILAKFDRGPVFSLLGNMVREFDGCEVGARVSSDSLGNASRINVNELLQSCLLGLDKEAVLVGVIVDDEFYPNSACNRTLSGTKSILCQRDAVEEIFPGLAGLLAADVILSTVQSSRVVVSSKK